MTPAYAVVETPRPRNLEPEDAWVERITKTERREAQELVRTDGPLAALRYVERLAQRLGVVTFGVKRRAAESLGDNIEGVRALAYVDRGDPYDPTVVYDERSGLLWWSRSWGDIVASDVNRVANGRSVRRRRRS